MSAVEMRELEWPDLEAAATLDEELFGRDAWSRQSWWAELAGRPRRQYSVAVAGDRVVGFAGIDCAGATADVMTIGVDPRTQGQGVGRRLLDRISNQARETGAEALLLEVRADNEVAQNLYRRAGFEHIRTRRGYYPPGNVDAHIMRAHLRGGQHG